MSITLQAIADELELSPATVSRALRQDQLISPETRSRVTETAQRLGYTGRARRPRSTPETKAKSYALGLLLRSESLAAAQSDTNLMKMMAGLMAVTDSQRILLHIHTVRTSENRPMDEDPEAVPAMIQEGACRAIIAHGNQEERDLAFLAKRVPVISLGRVYRTLPIDAVVGDNVEGVRALVKHLTSLGHRRLAWVGAQFSATFLEARQAGFIQGCLSEGLDINPRHCFGPEIFEGRLIRKPQVLLNAVKAGVTGFVCGNDGVALKTIEILEAAGHRVPEAVSVTGFDGWLRVRQFTTIDPHFYEIGEAAAHLALQRIAKPNLQPCIMSVRCSLMVGDTTAPAPR